MWVITIFEINIHTIILFFKCLYLQNLTDSTNGSKNYIKIFYKMFDAKMFENGIEKHVQSYKKYYLILG